METLRIDRADGVVTVTLEPPRTRRTRSTTTMWDELLETFRAIADSAATTACVVITGAGGDVLLGRRPRAATPAPARHQLAQHAPHQRRRAWRCTRSRSRPSPRSTAWPPAPGCNLALGCDLIVASDGARFSEIFARRGLSLDFGGSWLLPRLVGLHKAKELALLRRHHLAPRRRCDIGLVNRVVPVDRARRVRRRVGRRDSPPGRRSRSAMTKRLLNRSFESTLEQALEDEAPAQTVNFGTADTARGHRRRSSQKRDPRFRGR